MDDQAANGFVILLLAMLAVWWISGIGKYPMKVCPTCRGDGRDFERGTFNFRVCPQCGGNKSVPR